MHLFPQSMGEALDLRAEHPDALVLAGATSVQPVLNTGARPPRVLLDLSRASAADDLTRSGDVLRLGPMVTIAAAGQQPELRAILQPGLVGFGNPGVRRRGTVIGNILSDGPRDLLPVLLALDAVAEVASASAGPRRVELAALLRDGLAEGELTVGLRLTVPQRAAWQQVAVRRTGARALLSVAVAVLAGNESRVAAAAPGLAATRLFGAEPALVLGRESFVDAMARELADHRRAGALAARCWDRLA